MSGHNILQQLSREPEMDILDPGDAGTIAVDRTLGICSVVTAGAETRKIASPERAGIVISICLKTDGGDLTITGGLGTETTAVMADAGDCLTLISIAKGSDFVWSPLANNGATMS